MLLIGADQKEGVNKVPTKEEYDSTIKCLTAKSRRFEDYNTLMT